MSSTSGRVKTRVSTRNAQKSETKGKNRIPKEFIDKKDPLLSLLVTISYCKINCDVIDSLDKKLICGVLEMFGYKPMNLNINFVIELLKKFEGSTFYVQKESYEKILIYLLQNLSTIKKNLRKLVSDDCKEFEEELEDAVSVTCSLNQLQQLFCRNSKIDEFYSLNDFTVNDLINDCSYPSKINIFNLPFITTRLIFKNISMTHRNLHVNEFELVNMANGMDERVSIRQSLDLQKNPNISGAAIPKRSILHFLKQFKIFINNKYEEDISEVKVEISDVITEFEKDVSLCDDVMYMNQRYTCNLSPFPYVRYSKYDKDDTKSVPIKIHLKQSCLPRMSFFIENFKPDFELWDDSVYYIFDDYFSTNESKPCVSYSCTACDEVLKCNSNKYIVDHLNKYHGCDYDWKCTKCNNTYNTMYLSMRRWKHHCTN